MNLPAGVQESVADEVNSRLARATEELQNKYATGKGGVETSLDGPTGKAYQEKQAKELAEKKLRKEQQRQRRIQNQSEEGDLPPDDEDLDDGLDDSELERLREQRLRQLKKAHNEKAENISKGHGQFREITQDEFLSEVTNSMKVVCHFYHRDFPRCEIMNHHLQKLAMNHIECKFVKINAEKAPFFIDKVRITGLLTCILLNNRFALVENSDHTYSSNLSRWCCCR